MKVKKLFKEINDIDPKLVRIHGYTNARESVLWWLAFRHYKSDTPNDVSNLALYLSELTGVAMEYFEHTAYEAHFAMTGDESKQIVLRELKKLLRK